MKYCYYYRHPRTKNEITQYYAANGSQLEVPIKIRSRRNPKYLPNSWDDLERVNSRVRNWKIYRKTQWK